MKKAILIIVILAALSIITYAAPGCCCKEGSSHKNNQTSVVASATECEQGFTFTQITAQEITNPAFSCVTKCAQGVPVTPPPAPTNVCGAPGFTPEVKNFNILPVKGKQELRLNFELICPANFVKISRCEGTGCTDFKQVADIAPSTFFIDLNLKFDTDYTYQIIVDYHIQGTSNPATATGNIGDIECLGQRTNDEFCITNFYYSNFKSYLEKFGYAGVTPDFFKTTFEIAVNRTFNQRFNKAFRCNDRNKIEQQSLTCANGEFCIADDTGARCVKPGPCSFDTNNPFGLFATIQSCEGTAATKNFCFIDKALTIIDKCHSCSPTMNCHDYHTRGTCQRDNCGVGACEWHDTIPELGLGVCIDTRINNCPFCTYSGSPDAPNKDAISKILDKCSETKAKALSTPDFPCVFDKNTGQGKDCDGVACLDYTEEQCASPDNIILNPDNAINTGSNDVCQIKVCQFDQGTKQCIKNADGTPKTQLNWQDCAFNDRICESDVLPAKTTMIPTGKRGRFDFIQVKVSDRAKRGDAELEVTAKPGYSTILCAVTKTNTCADAKTYNVNISTGQIIIKNLALKVGQQEIMSIPEGKVELKFFTRDPFKNLETVKSVNFTSCAACSPPNILNITVTKARIRQGTFFTNAIKPTITIIFDEMAKVLGPRLVSKNGSIITLNQLTPEFTLNQSFIPTQDLNGTYNFSFNAQNQKGVFLDEPMSVEIIVDNSPITVNIKPENGTVLGQKDAAITLQFNRIIAINKLVLIEDSYPNEYALRQTPFNLATLLTNLEGQNFNIKLTNLGEGRKTIFLEVEDLAGNTLKANSTFFIHTKLLDFRMALPTFGVSPRTPFPILIETSTAINGPPPQVECRYVYDTPLPPPKNAFNQLAPFDRSGANHHWIFNFNRIPPNDNTKHLFHALCKDQFGIKTHTFELSVDPIAPIIIKAFADPDVVIEPIQPGTNDFATTLNVQTNKETFCKHSLNTRDFNNMENEFPGFDIEGKLAHTTPILVNETKEYTVFVACKGFNQLISQTKEIKFTVEKTTGFKVTSTTNRLWNTTSIQLGLATNKRAFCFYGENKATISRPFGNGSLERIHKESLTLQNSGKYVFFARCNAAGTSEISEIIELNIISDTTPPTMIYVNDTTDVENNTEKSFYTTRARVSFIGEDIETNITKYMVAVAKKETGEFVKNFTASTVLNGKPFYFQPIVLAENQSYMFKVKSVNGVGLESQPMESDGFIVDPSIKPRECSNGKQDQGETDIDCGGICGATCGTNKKCTKASDCTSNKCKNGKCANASCDDGIMSPEFETDIDCGGKCEPCGIGKTCLERNDCTTKRCKNGQCAEEEVCDDGELTPGSTETDIDCGGACTQKCGDGKNCQNNDDCEPQLLCNEDKTCSKKPDVDIPGEIKSCGDEIPDSWRVKYFGKVQCDGEGATDADPDNDGLTNLQEYRNGTHPLQADTDEDGWNDGDEIEKETDPLDPESYPRRVWLWIIFLLFALAGIAAGSYYGYEYYQKQKKPKITPYRIPFPATPTIPKTTPKPVPEDKMSKLKSMVKKPEELEKEEFIPLEKLKAPPLTEAPTKPSLFEKLKKLKEEKPQKLFEKQSMIKKKPTRKIEKGRAIEKLRKIKRTK